MVKESNSTEIFNVFYGFYRGNGGFNPDGL